MTFDYSNIESADSNIQTYISEILMPPVKTFFEAALKVIPRTGRIIVPSAMCEGLVTIPLMAQVFGYEGDIVIFVAVKNEPSASYLAKAIACGVDTQTKRPTIGTIIFNSAYISLDLKDITIEADLSTSLHEITHILGFSKTLYSLYRNPDTLEALTGHVFNKTVNGVPTMVLNVPPLTKRLRAHFNCPTLEGAYLENEGGPGSFGAHFERRVFFNEFMTASDMKDARFSEFTLALLEGTGWYQVDYSMAEPMTYGKNQGCEFLDTKCINPNTMKASFKEFCSPLSSRGVSWTRRGFGVCGASRPEINYNLAKDLDYWGNKTVVLDPFADNCPYFQIFADYDCEDASQQENAFMGSLEYFGIGGKAFMGTLSRTSLAQSRSLGYCFKTQCLKKEGGDYEVRVLFGKVGYATCSAAGAINPSSFSFENRFGGTLECPDPNDFCEQILSEGYCKGSCFGNGVCSPDGCKCFDGWTSYNCARRDLKDNCSRCNPNSNYTTCYGDDCVCSPTNITCQCALGALTGPQCPPNLGNNTTKDNTTDTGNNNNPDTGKDNGGDDNSNGGDDDGDNGNNNGNNNNNNNNNPKEEKPGFSSSEHELSRNIAMGVVVVLVVGIIIVTQCVKRKEKTRVSYSNTEPMMIFQTNQSGIL